MTSRLHLLALAAAAVLGAPTLGAQARAQAGQGATSMTLQVGFVIPPRLRFQVTNQSRVSQRGDTATYVMDVAVAANLAWTLAAVPAAVADAADAMRVRSEGGEWRALRAGEPTVTLAAGAHPSDWQPVRIEVQVVGARGPRAVPALTFDLQPAQR